MDTLGQKIRNLRKEKRLTQHALCAGLVTPSMISQIESDKATPSAQLLESLASRLGVTPSYFAEDVHQKTDLAHMYRRAKSLLEGENYEGALPLLLSLVENPSPQFRLEVLYTELAQCYEHLEQLDRAAETYDKIVSVALEKDDIPSAVYAYYYMGHVHRKLANPGLSRMYWRRSSELLKRHPDVTMPLAMKIYANLGRIHFILEDYAFALESYQEASRLAESHSAPLDLAVIYHGIANVYIETEELRLAREYTKKALELYDAVRHQRGVNQSYINLGVILRKQGYLTEAREHFTWCINHREIQEDSIRLANARYERAHCNLQLELLDEADFDAKQSMLIDHSTPLIQMGARAIIGDVLLRQQNYANAISVLSEGMELARKYGERARLAQFLNVLRQAYLGLNDIQAAQQMAIELAYQVLSTA